MYYKPSLVQELRGQHEPPFALLDAVNQLGEEFVDAVQGKTDPSISQQVLLTLFAQASNTLRAATLLLEAGYAVEAMMLTRPLFENFVNCCYIANSKSPTPDDLARRFISYQSVANYDRYKMLRDKMQRDGETLAEQDEEQFQRLREARAAFAAKYWAPGPHRDHGDWAGMQLWEKARQAQLQRLTDGSANSDDVSEFYQLLNPYSSDVLHGGPGGWVHIVEGSEDAVRFLFEPTDLPDIMRLAVPALSIFTTHIIGLVAKAFDLRDIVDVVEQTQEENLSYLMT